MTLTRTLKVTLNSNMLFYLMVWLIALHQAVSTTNLFSRYVEKDVLLLIPIAFLAIVQVFKVRSISREQLVISLFIILSIYTASVTNSSWLVYLFVVSFFLKGKDLEKLIKCIIIPTAIIFFINYTVFIFVYIKNNNALDFVVQDGIKRYFILYNSPNAPARILIFLILGYFYLKRNKISWLDILLTILIFVTTYFFTRSDALFLIFIILFLFGIKNRLLQIFHIMPKGIFLCELIISFCYSFFSENILFSVLNSFLVGRLSTSFQVFEIYGSTWFGQAADLGFQMSGNTLYKLLCDNSFYFIIVKYGIIYLLLITILILTSKTKKAEINLCYVIFILYMFIENQIFDFPAVFPLLIMLWCYLNKREILANNSKI